MLKEVQEKGVIFLDIDSGLREYPELFKSILIQLFLIMIISFQL